MAVGRRPAFRLRVWVLCCLETVALCLVSIQSIAATNERQILLGNFLKPPISDSGTKAIGIAVGPKSLLVLNVLNPRHLWRGRTNTTVENIYESACIARAVN
jgi:hypothetical protein